MNRDQYNQLRTALLLTADAAEEFRRVALLTAKAGPIAAAQQLHADVWNLLVALDDMPLDPAPGD